MDGKKSSSSESLLESLLSADGNSGLQRSQTVPNKLEHKIQLLGLLNSVSLKEAELMWTRYTTMLYVSTGLAGVLSFALDKNLSYMALGCAVIGLIISFVWVQMVRLSSYYYQRWQMDFDYLVSSDENLKEVIRGRLNPRLSKPTKWSASTYGVVIPISFAIGWVFILLNMVGLIKLF